MISEGRYTYSEERELREEEGEKGESAPPPCTTGQTRRCGATPTIKAGEPDPYMRLTSALARRAHTRDKKGEKARTGIAQAMRPRRKAPSLFADGVEQAMEVWALQLGPLCSKPMPDRQRTVQSKQWRCT